jgi:hypothetical protein
MRRFATALLVAAAILLAGLTFTAFWLQQTVFDPHRTEAAARRILKAPVVTNLVVNKVTAATTASLPKPVVDRVGQDRIRSATNEAVHDPRVVDTLVQASSRTHRHLADGDTAPVVLDGAPMISAVADALTKASPEAAHAVSKHPLHIEMSTKAVPDLSWANKLTATVMTPCAALAVLFAVFALAIAPYRPRVLNHLGGWLIGLSAFQLVAVWVIPAMVLPRFGAWGELLAQVASDVSGGVIGGLAVLFLSGVGCVVVSWVWAAARGTVELSGHRAR